MKFNALKLNTNVVSLKNLVIFLFLLLIILPPFFSGGRNIFIEEISSILIYLILAVFLFLPEENKLGTRDKKIYILLSLFLLFTLISSLFSVSPYRSLALWVKYLNYAILFYIVSNVIFKKEGIDFLMKSFLVAGGLLCLVGLFFYFSGNYIRVTSTFYWPNPFAGYLLFVLPLAFYYFFEEERKILSISLLTIIILSFILTGSRGAFLSFLVCFLLLGRYYFINFKKRLPAVFAAVCLVIFFIIIFSFIKLGGFSYLARDYNTANHLDSSSKIKLNYWDGSLKIFKSYPLFGSGFNTFSLVYPQYQKDPLSSGAYSHNWPLEMLAENGLFSLAIFIIFLSFVFIQNKAVFKKDDFKTALFFGALASIIHNFIDIDWHFDANFIVFWAFLGLLNNKSLGNSLLATTQNEEKINYKLFFKSIILFIIFLLFLKSAFFISSSYFYNKGVKSQVAGELPAALQFYKKSTFLNPNPDYLRQYGIILYSLGLNKEGTGHLNEAEKVYQKLLKLDPNNSLNYELGGKIYAAKENTDQARIAFKKAISLNKLNHPSFYYDLAVILIKEGKLKEAKEILNSIIFFYPAETVERKKMIILANQVETSGIEKDISDLYYLLDYINKREK